jgi:cyclopropane fatty-acyl-phospholipid synthase-like methyltransferase
MNEGRTYIHGYTEWEQIRLLDQNDVLAKYIYHNLDFSPFQHAFEIGSGVGAQMLYLLKKYPNLKITGIDIDSVQIDKASGFLHKNGIAPERYRLLHLDSADDSWLTILKDDNVDVVYTVWVLEHLNNPSQLIQRIFQNCHVGTKFFATETYHRSFNIIPDHPFIISFWNRMINNQISLGGNPNVGLLLGSFFHDAGFKVLRHNPFHMLFDNNNISARNEIIDYWINLMLAAKDSLMLTNEWDDGEWRLINDHMESLKSSNKAIFYYSFMQMEAVKE